VWTVVLFLGLTVIGAGLFGAAGAAYATANPRAYRSEALVAVLPSATAATSTTVTTPAKTTVTSTTPVAVGVSADYTGIWVQLANSDLIRQAVAGQLGVSESEVSSTVTVAAGSTSAAVVSITAKTPDAGRSARYANAMADQLIARNSAAPVPGYSVLVVSRATPPAALSGLSRSLVVGGAALVGAVAGLAVANGLRRRRRRPASGR
jgi:capsular polysaccharide biosynthesis protein